MTRPPAPGVAQVRELLAQVPDPEVPVVSVLDLGIVRDVAVEDDAVTVTVTPTYSGCPATAVIEQSIRDTLAAHFAQVEVRTVLSPAWTTDWMTDAAKEKLRAYGIAPPGDRRLLPVAIASRPDACPACGSTDVERISEFGSTACKSLWRCVSCREPFDHFKAY